MKQYIILPLLIIAASILSTLDAQVHMNFNFDTPYGDNSEAGKYVELNGAKIYYEEYGEGEPLLLIHGNGASIIAMGNQADYFKSKYRVIIADSRGHGKSELNTDSLTYDQMAEDWEALAKHLKLDSFSIIGWSDGGIIALKMGISGHLKIKKIAAMGANLRPDSTAIHTWAIENVLKEKAFVNTKIKENDNTQNWNLHKQLIGLLTEQPNIPVSDLLKIKAQVLVIAGDEDIIKNEHSMEIYKHIPHAHLCIMPGETHFAPASSPAVFNEMVNKFLSEPFKRPDSDWTKMH